MNRPNRTKLKSCTGFTMMEMMIVMAIISILLSIGVYIYNQQVKNSRISEATAFIERDLVTGIMTCRRQVGTYNLCAHQAGDTDSNLIMTGIKISTPWQTDWSITVDSGTFSLRYPVGDDRTAVELAASLTNTKARYLKNANSLSGVVTATIAMP